MSNSPREEGYRLMEIKHGVFWISVIKFKKIGGGLSFKQAKNK